MRDEKHIAAKALSMLYEWNSLNQSHGWKTIGNDTQYTIIEHETEVHLLFQWSMSFRDWLYNLDFAIKPYKDQKSVWYAHRGFVNVWKSIQDTIHTEIKSKLNGRKLVIMGHSHGGSLSVLAHEFFQYNGFNPETYSFAGFRVCWKPSSEILSRFENMYTILNIGDIITYFPMKIFGWKHVGYKMRIGHNRFISHIPHMPNEYEKALLKIISKN